MEIRINDAMDSFLSKYFGSKRNNQEQTEKYLSKIIRKDRIRMV